MDTERALQKALDYINETHTTLVRLRDNKEEGKDEKDEEIWNKIDDFLSRIEKLEEDIAALLPSEE
jgi:hypothetical protein